MTLPDPSHMTCTHGSTINRSPTLLMGAVRSKEHKPTGSCSWYATQLIQHWPKTAPCPHVRLQQLAAVHQCSSTAPRDQQFSRGTHLSAKHTTLSTHVPCRLVYCKTLPACALILHQAQPCQPDPCYPEPWQDPVSRNPAKTTLTSPYIHTPPRPVPKPYPYGMRPSIPAKKNPA
jgi:hypothetical protein